jgi:uridine kinase
MTQLVGIAGGTGAGKSMIARGLVERLGGCILGVDSYYWDLCHLSPEARARHNFDEPDAIDADLFVEHLISLAGGEAIEKPVYSFETHTRIGMDRVTPARLMFVDGLFAFWWPSLRALLDLKIYVDAPPDLRLARRIQRDVKERGRDVEPILTQYFSTVRRMHELYVEPTRAYADLVVTNTGSLEDCLGPVLTAIRNITSDRGAGLAAGGREPPQPREEHGRSTGPLNASRRAET